ncbi:FAD-linked oxidoreductase-like protein [Mortierella sp. GBAus27b]|nr:FAD-linked oxidoreductase-like protein [Mortierella sp. GBAus27b]
MKANSTAGSSLRSSQKGEDVVQDLENEHNRIAVEEKSASELWLSMLIYKVCTFNRLVDMAPGAIRLAEILHCSPPVHWVIRKTFFAQFCGGETANECIGTMTSFRNAGINSILDLSVEADVNGPDTAHLTPDELRAWFNNNADNNASQIAACIATASTIPKSFAAIKVTALSSPLLLQQVSSTLTALRAAFKDMDQDGDGRLNKSEFHQLVAMLSHPDQDQESRDHTVDQLFKGADKDQDGFVDWIDFSSTVSLGHDETRALFTAQNVSDGSIVIPGLTKEDLEDYRRLLDRMESLCKQAKETRTRLMIDAEQTYFQPAIDGVVLHLQEHYNRIHDVDGPLIFNTYQMYLKDALGRLQQDHGRAQRNGYVMAVKMVRGAYMVSERKRAQELNLEDPIHKDIEATHASYNAGIDLMLEKITRKEPSPTTAHGMDQEVSSSPSLQNSSAVLFVASHNRDSVIQACKRMKELDLGPQSGLVMFGQLMGMCDQISYTLGQHGFDVYKYIPYGAIQDVIPYLVRRAQENSSVLSGVTVERSLLWEELKKRLK